MLIYAYDLLLFAALKKQSKEKETKKKKERWPPLLQMLREAQAQDSNAGALLHSTL